MHIMWTSHIKDEEEKVDFKAYIANSTALLDRLTDIINMKIDAAEKARVSEKGYDNATWPFKQADLNGFVRALNEIKTLTQRKD